MAIRWTKSDYITLGKAVANFNKKVRELEKEGYKNLLQPLEYKEVKENILNRRELRRKINSLKRINNENVFDLIIDENKGFMTRYEFEERKRYQKKIKKDLSKELANKNKFEKPYKTQTEMKVENILKNLNKYDTSSLEYFSRADLQDLRSIKYKEKYLEGLEKYSNFKGYDELMKKVQNKSPKQFYEAIKDNEMAADLKYQYYAHYSEAEFLRYLKDAWNIDVGEEFEENDIVSDFMEVKYENSKGKTVEF